MQRLYNIHHDINTIVHCDFGNHRSPLVVEAAYHEHYADEYKNYYNHLHYDSQQGFLPYNSEEIESKLSALIIR